MKYREIQILLKNRKNFISRKVHALKYMSV